MPNEKEIIELLQEMVFQHTLDLPSILNRVKGKKQGEKPHSA
jgi:hypothetical protein